MRPPCSCARDVVDAAAGRRPRGRGHVPLVLGACSRRHRRAAWRGGARRGGGAGMALAVGTVEVCTRNRISPIAVEQQPPSRDPTTRPLRTTEEPAPSVTLPPTSVHVIVWCGDKPVVLRSLGGRCERHKRASRAWSACWPASPKGRVESEPRGPPQLQGVRGVACTTLPKLRIATVRRGLKVFVLIAPRAQQGEGRRRSTLACCARSSAAGPVVNL